MILSNVFKFVNFNCKPILNIIDKNNNICYFFFFMNRGGSKMKLFKNGVGRPSNETIKKRKIVVLSIVLVVFAMILGSAIFIAGFTANTMKAEATLKKFSLSCDGPFYVNKEFTCKTNTVGVEITVDKTNLASGYNASFITTSSDLTKQIKYTKSGIYSITATKSGYKTITKQINVISLTNQNITTTKANNSSKNNNISILKKMQDGTVRRTVKFYRKWDNNITGTSSYEKCISYAKNLTVNDSLGYYDKVQVNKSNDNSFWNTTNYEVAIGKPVMVGIL